jgi:hypothetical protein
LLCGLLTGVFAGAPDGAGAAAVDVPLKIESVSVGIGDAFKIGEWTALRLEVRASSPQQASIVVEAPDCDADPAIQPSPPIEVPAGETRWIETRFRTGRGVQPPRKEGSGPSNRIEGELVVRLVDAKGAALCPPRRVRLGDDASFEARPALRPDTPLWVTWSKLPDLRDKGAAARPGEAPAGPSADDGTTEPHVVTLDGLDGLPDDVLALQSIDFLIFPTAKRSDGKSLLGDLTPARSALLREWVLGGGNLLITVGSEEAAYRASPLAEWVPAKVEGGARLRQLVDLDRFSDTGTAVRFSEAIPAAQIAALPLRNVLVKQGSGPLIAAVPYGFGLVTLCGLDLEKRPFPAWPSLPAVLRKLAGIQVRSTRQQAQTNRQLTHTGVTDLATQFQGAQEDFPAVERPSHWWVMGLLFAYLAVIGPLDYLIVGRWLRRPEWTWLTLLILIGLGAGAAAWGAARANGRGLLVNQFDLIDIDEESQTSRGRSWASLYSPENHRYAVSIEPARGGASPEILTGSPRLSWCGVPESSIGGIYRSSGTSLGGRSYRFSADGATVENLPVLQWSTKTLSAEWSIAPTAPLVESQLESSGAGRLVGTLTHHLPAPLEDVMLVVGGWAYFPVGDKTKLAPNVPWRLGAGQSTPRDLKAYLTGESVTRSRKGKAETEVVTRTAAYDSLGRNRVELVNMLSFHRAAGGSEYTNLAHAALRDLELTRSMELGRGVLVGRMGARASRVRIDGQEAEPAEAFTFVRLVVPVRHHDFTAPAQLPRLRESP